MKSPVIDRVQASAAREEPDQCCHQTDHHEPGDGGRVALPRLRCEQTEDRNRRRSEYTERWVRGRERRERQTRRGASQDGGTPLAFHSVFTWYAGLNPSFDRMEER
jgi:hypothetical protein